jgi:Phage ABA sandwich domain
MTTQEMRELDVWIAEHVMEWREVNCLRDFCSGSFLRNADCDCLAFECQTGTWKPTTDPAAAMAVLEKCAEKLRGMDISIRRRTVIGTGWLITWSGDYHNASEETLPQTICAFARELFKEETK